MKTAKATGTRKSPTAAIGRKRTSPAEPATTRKQTWPARAFAPVKRTALPIDTLALARWLLGRIVVRRIGRSIMAGRIVETEAYMPEDAASHAFRGPTPRNRSMYLARGHVYVYFIYGTSFMLNIASGAVGYGAAVLIRALEPVAGLKAMQRRRGGAPPATLTNGPGRLCQALAIDRRLDGADMCKRGPLYLSDDSFVTGAIATSPRIGIRRNVSPLWRFHLEANPHVSRGPRYPERQP